MFGSNKDFKDLKEVSKAMGELGDKVDRITQPYELKNMIYGVKRVDKRVGSTYGTNEAGIINNLIDQFNTLIKNIEGH